MNKDKVMALIRKKHEETGVSINTLLLLFFFEHFLERVSSSCYKTDLVLKGGFLLSSMWVSGLGRPWISTWPCKTAL